VLAGAGSGKTRVLVHRIAWLIRVEGVSAHGIMAVTFTNKAAKEMRARIEQVVDIPSRGLWIGTFHGLAHRLLKAHWQDANLPQNFQILDGEDQLRLVKRVMGELQIDDTRWQPKQAQYFINGHKDEGRRVAHIDTHGDLFHQTMLRIYRGYEEACERGGLVDFAEILLRAHELWLQKPLLLAHYQQRFQHLLVDEFQDTNAIQYAWLRVLAGKTGKLMAVGDDDQSIYGWRGARIENIQQFEKDFADTRVIRLEQNYRSTGTILKAANAVIANNNGRLGKELWTQGKDGESIALYAGFNEQDEARFIVERIDAAVKEDMKRSEIAILYRSNAQSRVLEDALLRIGMPYRIYGGLRFYDRMEIKNAVAYMRLILNRNDDTALERVINTPVRGIGGKTVDDIRTRARDHGESLWRAAGAMVAANEFSPRAGNAVRGFLDLIEKLDNETDPMDLAELADHVIKVSGLLEFHKQEKGEKGQTRVENLQELTAACRQFAFDDTEETSPLRQFLDNAALDAGEGQADEFEDAVQLMTLHSAKGLEFPIVFMAGVEENLFPHKMSLDEPGRLEEERRLCYVGITRAMKKLYITYAESRRLYGSDSYNTPSRFIREIPTELVQEVRLRSSVSRPLSSRFAGGPAHAAAESGFMLGQRVLHQIFGEGIILNVEGNGPSTRVQVNFDGEGSKWLVLQYAKLEAMS
jgi:DNA helicase II / ATP-dependent DNA helicase PcrA